MMTEGIAVGVPFDENVRLRLMEAFPGGTLSVTRGRHYSLEEKALYLVRGGSRAVIMPRMTYSGSVAGALDKENAGGGD